MNIDTTSPVMITGATGYVAGWIVKRLLEAGVTVHAPVRDPFNEQKIAHLKEMAEKSSGKIKFFQADLLQKGSYADAMKGCSIVFHTASPFQINVSDPQKELIDPALEGTRNVLIEVKRHPEVKRVVLTSSCAAIYTDNIELQSTPAGVFTEELWNTTASLTHQPYCYSKTLAEKEAWRMNDDQPWKLVVINPSFVMGPALSPFATSTSVDLMRQMGDGTMKSGVADIGFGIIDVRDLAEAHVRAAFMEQANGRNIISGHNSSFLEMAQILHKKWGAEFPVPNKAMPKWLVWLVAPLVNKAMTRQYISSNVGLPWRADNSKARKELAMEFRPLRESLNEMFAQMVESGQISPKRG